MKKISRKITLFFVGLAAYAVATSCSKCVKGDGVDIVEDRNLVPFTGIISEGDFDIFVHQVANIDSVASNVKIQAPSKVISFIYTYVDVDDNLVIKVADDVCLKIYDNPIIDLWVEDLSDIMYDGNNGFIQMDTLYASNEVFLTLGGRTSDIQIDYVDAELVDVLIDGSDGLVAVKGYAPATAYEIKGSGRIDALDLNCITSTAVISGTGVNNQIFLRAERNCFVSIPGQGVIDVYGPAGLTVNQGEIIDGEVNVHKK